MLMTDEQATAFGQDYAATWSSGDPAEVVAMFTLDGTIIINGGPPAAGPQGIEGVAKSYMTAFPDLRVDCERMERDGPRWKWFWRMRGTFSGPGGTGKRVDIRGWEVLSLSSDGRIIYADGHYNQAEYERQLGL